MLLVYENRTDGIVVEWKKTVHFPPHLHEAIEVVYVTDGDIELGIAVLSFVLLFYAYKSGRYQFCYVVTIIMIFLMMFPYLFFKSGHKNFMNM